MKKTLSIILALLMVLTFMPTVAFANPSLDYNSVYVAGNGTGGWMNGVAWDAGNAANKMTEVSEDVWEITFENVSASSDTYQFKFCIDGSWATNFGGTFAGSGVETDAVYNSQSNIAFAVAEDNSTVKIQLNLTNYDNSTQQGAKFTVTINDAVPLPTSIDEGFEGGTLPDGWTTTDSDVWAVGTGDYDGITGAHTGEHNAKAFYSGSGGSYYLITPALDLSGKDSATLNFWYINRSWSGDVDELGIYYRINGGEWAELSAISSSHSSWTELQIELPEAALASNVQIGFRMTANYGYGVGLDDVKIGGTATVPSISLQDVEFGASYTPEKTVFNYYDLESSDITLELFSPNDYTSVVTYSMENIGSGVWNYELSGDYKGWGYRYNNEYGTVLSDPYGNAKILRYVDEYNSSEYYAICDLDSTDPDGWENDTHVFNITEENGAIARVDIYFASNGDSGVSEANRPTYLAFTETGTTLGSAGNYSTCIDYLKASGYDTVYINFADLMAPNSVYENTKATSNPYDCNVPIKEIKQAIMAMHQAGLSVVLDLGIDDYYWDVFCGNSGGEDIYGKYLTDIITFWVDEYHVDGVNASSGIREADYPQIRSAVDEFDSRIFIAGGNINAVKYQNWMYSFTHGYYDYVSSDAVLTGMSSGIKVFDMSNMLVGVDNINMNYMAITLASMSKAKPMLSLGDEFGLRSSDNYSWAGVETNQQLVKYFNDLQALRKLAPFSKGSSYSAWNFQSGDCFGGKWTSAYDGVYKNMLFVCNATSSAKSFNLPSGSWTVIGNGTKINLTTGFGTATGSYSVQKNTVCILVDKASFDALKPAPAVTNYDLWVGGTRVTSANTSDVLGNGSVAFDSETSTLTLSNANLSGADSESSLNGVINSKLSQLTISLDGENVIDGEYNNDGIDAAGGCNVTILGEGSLDINNSYYGTYIGSWDVDGGDLTVTDEAEVTVTNSSAAGIWVNHDINFLENCVVTVSRTGSSYNGIVSNVGGTITVDGGTVTVTNPNSAIHFGNTDDSAHAFNLVSGNVTVTSTEGYGIFCQPVGDTGTINATLTMDGGRLEVNSVSGATNIPNVNINSSLSFTTGTGIDDANIVIEEAPAMVTVNFNANGGTTGALWVDSLQIPADEFEVGSLLNPPAAMITAPEGYAFDGLEVNGVKVNVGETPVIADGTETINVKFLWKSTAKNGWVLEEDGAWYYYTAGEPATGWKSIGGRWYYFNAEGAMQTGWVKDGGVWYFLNEKGAMHTGWLLNGGQWYYLKSNGAMVTGWQQIKGAWYFFAASGRMCTGWVHTGGQWYYMMSDGTMHTGWLLYKNDWYYLKSNGAMLRNTSQRIGSKTYTFNNDGVCTNP